MKNVPAKKSPLTFFILVYGLSIPLWIIETTIDADRLPLNFSITDVVATFTPLITASILVYKEHGQAGVESYSGEFLTLTELPRRHGTCRLFFYR